MPDLTPLRAAAPRAGPPGRRGVAARWPAKAAGLRTAAALYGVRLESELRREGADEYWEVTGG